MAIEKPSQKNLRGLYRTSTQKVQKEWIDYNGHMNVAYYTLAFDRALDFFFEEALGIGPSYVKEHREGPFALKASYTYFSELLEDESFYVEIGILDFDTKRVHLFGNMKKEKSSEVSAIFETVLINVDLDARKGIGYSQEVNKMFKIFKNNLVIDELPSVIGKRVSLKR